MEEQKEKDTAPEAEKIDPVGQTGEAAPETEETVETATETAAGSEALAAAEDKFLRLAAEYDNFRKRTAKEKESIWTEAKAQTVAGFLPVYDNLERALKQETADDAYKKGVELTMKGFQDALTKLGVEMIPAMGESFDPNLHNAVMHVDDEAVEENTVVEVFQQGFKCGEKVIRFAMVKVAN